MKPHRSQWRTMLRGAASVLSLHPPKLPKYPFKNESEALARDWQKVMGDLNTVIERERKRLSDQETGQG
jgi:hypothetical protein